MRFLVEWTLLLFLLEVTTGFQSARFLLSSSSRRLSFSQLDMGKGFNAAKGKQAALLKKMELAKKQNNPSNESEEDTQERDEQTQLEKDRSRFAKLLAESNLKEVNIAQAQAKAVAARDARVQAESTIKVGSNKKRKKRKKKQQPKSTHGEGKPSEEDVEKLVFQEGDTATRRSFESLVSCETGNALGPIAAAQLVPWVPPYLNEFLIVVADPRTQSGDLRQGMKYILSNVEEDILENILVVNADSVVETKTWLKRAEIDDSKMQLFSDSDWEWMKAYSVVGDSRWSMSVLLFDTSGCIRKIEREVDPSHASQVVKTMAESIEIDL